MPRPRTVELSPAHRRILRVLGRFEQKSQPAFVPALVEALEFAGANSLVPTLQIMARNGFVEIRGGGVKGSPRWVELTDKGRQAAGLGGLPLIGSIPAGPLAEALAQPEEIVSAEDLLPHRDGDFLLRVMGDSMVGDGIFDGDLVLIRPRVEAAQGEIAAVQFGENYEATLKRVFRRGQRVTLRASNPKYPEVVLSAAQVRIAGVFRGLIRYVHHRA
jgi:repressor LexA